MRTLGILLRFFVDEKRRLTGAGKSVDRSAHSREPICSIRRAACYTHCLMSLTAFL
jgi:hypothetical protein